MYMVAIGMPRGFEWLFMFALLLVPLSLGLIGVLRGAEQARGQRLPGHAEVAGRRGIAPVA
jgi:hypothetical protein